MNYEYPCFFIVHFRTDFYTELFRLRFFAKDYENNVKLFSFLKVLSVCLFITIKNIYYFKE
jgi:hypothetical protein